MLDKELNKRIVAAQRNEITEYFIYKKIAETVRNPAHAEVLEKLAGEERGHYDLLKSITGTEVKPDKLKIFLYALAAKILGLNFALKLLESGEDLAQKTYEQIKVNWPQAESVLRDEKAHEFALINLIDEDRLKYAGSIVLGVNDALVELTASLAGFTLALQNTRLIGMVGLITGIAAAMSMAAAEYLSSKEEGADRDPFKASTYTGIAYIMVVSLLVFPYFIFENVFMCLGIMLAAALLIIAGFTFYITVAKELSFRKRFLEMAAVSLGVAGLTFFIGLAVKSIFGIEV